MNLIKVIIGIVVALLVVGGATVFGVTQYQKKRAAEEYAQRVEEYSDNLKLATVTMLTGASDAESSANLIKQVWYNAIYEKRDDKTDKYTRPKGYFVSDFNDALGNLYADSSFSSKISSMADNQVAALNFGVHRIRQNNQRYIAANAGHLIRVRVAADNQRDIDD